MSTDIRVKGLAEIQKFLDALPPKIEKNMMRAALRAGARVIMAEAKLLCPVGRPSTENIDKYGGYPGALRDSIRVTTGYRNGTVMAKIVAGGKTKTWGDAYYAHMVEGGTAVHVIAAQPGGSLFFGDGYPKLVAHPGIQAKPFMRPALDHEAEAAVIQVGLAVQKRLTKAGIDAMDVKIEGDD